MTNASDHEHTEEAELAHHPEPRTYVSVAIILAIVTAIEVALSYIGGVSDAVIVTLLIVSAVIKFVLVVLWFMHLRFDSLIFRRLFVTGLILALSVFAIVLFVLFGRGGPVPLVTG